MLCNAVEAGHSLDKSKVQNVTVPGLDAELETVRPELIVCLGAVAAQSLLGSSPRSSLRCIRPRFSEHAQMKTPAGYRGLTRRFTAGIISLKK
jgi:uracil-DNA glycosylase